MSTPEVPGPSRSWDPPAAAPSSLLDLCLCLSVAVAASASSFLTQPCTLSQHVLQEHIDIWATSGRALQLAAVGNHLLLLVLHATRRPVRGILLARHEATGQPERWRGRGCTVCLAKIGLMGVRLTLHQRQTTAALRGLCSVPPQTATRGPYKEETHTRQECSEFRWNKQNDHNSGPIS